MKTILMLSTSKSNKSQHALIVSVIILFSYLILTPFQLYGQQSATNQFPNDDYKQYENPEQKISLLVPSNWNITESDNTINFSSPLEGKSDLFREGLYIEILSSGNIPLKEKVSLDIIALKQTLENFALTYSDANFRVSNYPAYVIIYSYVINNTTNYDAMKIWAVIGRNTYTISYDAESDNFQSYLPLIQDMIYSLRVVPPETTREPVQNTAGLRLRNNPYNVAVDATTNRIYVTNLRSDTVSVIDGQKDNILTDIRVGTFPSAIDVDPDSGRIFVTNRDSDTVSVIDGSTNTVIANVDDVGARPTDIVIDPTEEGTTTLIFVSNSNSDTVSVIDGSTNTVIANISVREEPVDLAINTITNRLYVANYQNNTVSVIDYYLSKNEGLKNETVANMQVGNEPVSIDFNPITNTVYVSNSNSDTVSVIDGSTNTVIADIPVGTSPYGIAVNTEENLIYVANYLSNSISVIDGSTNEVVDTISVSRFPFTLSYNPANKIAYVAHLSQNMLSMINNTRPVIGVTFEVNPADSGYINCNGRDFLNGDYFRYNVNTTLDCLAVPNAGFSFTSWSGDLTSTPITSSQTTFEVSRFGNVSANFIVPIEFTLPQEYWDQLSIILLSVIIPAVAGWSIPSIAGWVNGKMQRRHLREYMTRIYEVNEKSDSKDAVEYLRRLEEIRTDIERALADGKIRESHYDILNSKILEGLEAKK